MIALRPGCAGVLLVPEMDDLFIVLHGPGGELDSFQGLVLQFPDQPLLVRLPVCFQQYPIYRVLRQRIVPRCIIVILRVNFSIQIQGKLRFVQLDLENVFFSGVRFWLVTRFRFGIVPQSVFFLCFIRRGVGIEQPQHFLRKGSQDSLVLGIGVRSPVFKLIQGQALLSRKKNFFNYFLKTVPKMASGFPIGRGRKGEKP